VKENFKKAVLLLGMSITIPTVSIAQENIETDISADLVSGYIWRGQDLGNVSIQPTLSVSYKGFSLSAWGSVGFEGKDTKELDLTLGYTTGGFSISSPTIGLTVGRDTSTMVPTIQIILLKHKSDMTSDHWQSTGIQILQVPTA